VTSGRERKRDKRERREEDMSSDFLSEEACCNKAKQPVTNEQEVI
jgi:hypothetical protein